MLTSAVRLDMLHNRSTREGSSMHIGRDVGGLPVLCGVLATVLIAAGCRDSVSPERGAPGGRGSSQSPTGAHLTGLGAIGPGTATPGSDRQSFDFDVSDAPGGRFTYTDYSLVRSGGGVATVTVDPTADPATAITSFDQISATCVTFGGSGRQDDGRLVVFVAEGCDNGSPGNGVDFFRISIPNNTPYHRFGRLTEGEITLSGGTPPATVRIAGVGTVGPGTPTVGSDLQEFDFDVTSTSSGRLFYRDWSTVRPNGTVATVIVDADSTTWITAFRDGSTVCADPTHGVEFDGIGRVDTGEFFEFTVVACDNGPAGSGPDFFRLSIPAAPNYVQQGFLSSGDIAKNQAPTAAFTARCNGLACAFTDGSSDPDGSVVAWQWSFGDGGTATAQSPSHSYATAGSYTVTLTVTDNQGATGSTSRTVTVTAPNQPPTASFTYSCNGLTCSFTSTSSDPDGTITAYNWTFGDGTSSTAQNPTHSYAATGSYTVALTVTDNQGATGSTSQTVTVTRPNQPPTASFTYSCNGLNCAFTSTSTDPDGTIVSYNWTFGDGTSATAQNPSHSYAAAGSYTVALTVTDNQGATGSTSQTVTVTQPNQPPSVNAGPDQTVLLGLLYTLNASFSDPDNGPWSYTINWGDGSSSSGSRSSPGTFSASHNYILIGSYTIRVTVTDSQGASGWDTKVLTVLINLGL